MKIIKRNGAEVVFDIDKINMAVTKANEAVDERCVDPAANRENFPERPDRLRGNGAQPVRGGDSGSGGEGHHGSRRF